MSYQNTGRADVSFEAMFPRIHKLALGVAIGVTLGGILWLLTIVHILTGPLGLPLILLRQYFYGYTVTWSGAFIGFAWAFSIGLGAGWLLGAVHNMTVDTWLLIIRTRTDLSLKRHFVDHIR